MGGQACVLYGAAEFSRDTDLAVLSDAENLPRLARALDELRAKVIAVPPFEQQYLDMGLAVHFRCEHPDASQMRVDVMSKMRNVDPFPALWRRRTTIVADELEIDLMALPDLVRAKKTQRDKDWPMVTRLIERSYFNDRHVPSSQQIEFWLKELRTPDLLIECTGQFPHQANQLVAARPLLASALANDFDQLRLALAAEERAEREADTAYWKPLKSKLAELRKRRP